MIKGIIMLSSPANESFFSRLDAYGVPVVVIGKVEGEFQNIYSVDTDNFHDSATLTDNFIANGRCKIACMHAPLDYHVSIDRLAGYKYSLQKHNIAINDDWIIDGGYTHESALTAAIQLLSSATPPDAVFATDSMKLLSLYRAADELNLMIPEHVAIAGYSDPMLSLILTPAPGGFDIPTRRLGEESCDLLFKRIAGKPAQHKVLVETHFTFADALR
jgi:DNA-binding LacI/PurR family transcriptional regulator